MTNPYKPFSSEWAAREKEQGQRGNPTSSQMSINEFKKRREREPEPPHCFPSGTMIRTPFDERAIETLSRGDLVISWSDKNQGWKIARVQKKIDHSVSQLTQVIFNDGTVLRATEAHTLLTERGWMTISKLHLGDRVKCLNSSNILSIRVVKEVFQPAQFEPVYNLITDKYHNFVADGVIVHNFTYFRMMRMMYWRLRTAPDFLQAIWSIT